MTGRAPTLVAPRQVQRDVRRRKHHARKPKATGGRTAAQCGRAAISGRSVRTDTTSVKRAVVESPRRATAHG